MKIEEIFIKNIDVVENHRVNVQDTAIHELMQSIKQHGLKQPIGVIPNTKKGYDLVFGNRRLIACEKLGWTKITCSVMDAMEMKELLVLNLTENMQRKDPSFPEFGRAIERLQKMGLNTQEIAVRLGVDEKKVKQILSTYKKLPAKHREKVEFMGKGKNIKGVIPTQLAIAVVRMKKSYGLSDKACDELFKNIKEDAINHEDLKNLCILLNTGLKYEDAFEKMFDYSVYTVQIVAQRLEIGKLVAENQLGSHQILFKRIIYGQMKGIKKPDFIKV